MEVRKWVIKNNQLSGYVYGSPRYEDGTPIHTSPIVTAAVDDGLFLIRTENSVYECFGVEYAGEEADLNQFIEWCREGDRQTTRQIFDRKD